MDWDRVRRGEVRGVELEAGHYEVRPFYCGQWGCPACGPEKSARVRGGIRRAVRELGLEDLLTLTLYRDLDLSPVESRTKISRLRNAFFTRLRSTVLCASSSCRRPWRYVKPSGPDAKRQRPGRTSCPSCGNPVFVRFLMGYVNVDEAQEDGTAHCHVAIRLDGLRAWLGNDASQVEAFLGTAWGNLGGGFVEYSRGRDSAGGSRSAAGYLTKYIAKGLRSPPPWATMRWCTEDQSFRTRPWHRFSASRDASRIIAGRKRESTATAWNPWKLVLEVERTSGRMAYEPWNPAVGSAIMKSCGGHDPVPEWVPGSCHHGGGPIVKLEACYCVPPWAFEIEWEALDPELAALVAWDQSESLCAAGCTCDLHRPRELRDDSRDFRHADGRGGPIGWAG